MNSFDLFLTLHQHELLKNSPPLWWPNAGTFEVIVGALLTQQSKWEKVIVSLNNLSTLSLLTPESLCQAEPWKIASAITPSGFYNQKAMRLQKLCQNMIADFGNFSSFQENVSREWLLAQKGIGPESADAILCYGCFRDEMVVDAYTAKLLTKLGFEFESYEEIKEWCQEGISTHYHEIEVVLGEKNIFLSKIYALFHGMIVESGKKGHNLFC